MTATERWKMFSARLPALLTALAVAVVFFALSIPMSPDGGQAHLPSEPVSVSKEPPGSRTEEPSNPAFETSSAVPAAPESASSAPVMSEAAPPSSSAPASSAPASPSVPASTAPSPPPAVDGSALSDAALVGNSFVEALNAYNLLPQTDCFGRIGLNVRTALTKSTLKGDVPVIDELKGRTYNRIFLVFGENELGWNSIDLFIEAYGRLVDEVRQRQPAAKIYIESIFPVSAAVSEKNIEQTNNRRIDEFNGRLRQLAADKGIGFVDGASVMRDENGVLPADAATDGVHPKVAYYKRWVAYLEEQT